MSASLEAERSILAAMMLDPAAARAAASVLQRSDFHLNGHGYAFAALVALSDEGKPLDLVTLSAKLSDQGHLEAVGGPGFLSGLLEGAGTAANWRAHADIVKRHKRARDVRAGAAALAQGLDARMSPEAVQDAARRLAELARPSDAVRGPSHVSRGLADVFTTGVLPSVPTGLTDLAELDITAGQLCCIGARPGVGKTAFLGTMALAAAQREWDVLFISLEMPALEIQQRLIAGIGGIPLGLVKQCADPAMVRAAERLAALSLWVEDGNEEPRIALDVEGIAALVGMFAEVGRGERPRVVLVDYLQYVRTRQRFDRRHEAVGHVCRELKRIAKDNRIPMVVAAQLNRLVEQRGKDARPQMSDLAESGDIEKNADKILFLHREDDGKAFVKVAKNRQGPCWTIEARYIGELCQYADAGGWQ